MPPSAGSDAGGPRRRVPGDGPPPHPIRRSPAAAWSGRASSGRREAPDRRCRPSVADRWSQVAGRSCARVRGSSRRPAEGPRASCGVCPHRPTPPPCPESASVRRWRCAQSTAGRPHRRCGDSQGRHRRTPLAPGIHRPDSRRRQCRHEPNNHPLAQQLVRDYSQDLPVLRRYLRK